MIRVRFAPSPTGFFHIGSARTALFNWLYARHCGGTFILRIEDTDEARNTQEALDVLLKGMRWLGLDWDEGPEVGGPYGPYFQSQREAVYVEFIEKLRKSGHAYEQDGALYFKVSGQAQLIDDIVRGQVERTEEKDFVIVRSNGKPVFHLVNVVDDIAMGITHVVRGEDHLSNTSKHLELFKAFGAPLPRFAHIPLILKSDGPGKMSKRDQGALIEDYSARHYLPEALCNYLSLLGWSPKNNREILSIKEIVDLFELSAINPNNAHFDEKKLTHINAEYVKKLSPPQLLAAASPVLDAAGLSHPDLSYLQGCLLLAQEKISTLEELPRLLRPLLTDDFPINPESQEKVFKNGNPVALVTAFLEKLPQLASFDAETLEATVNNLAQANAVSTGSYMQPLRLALTGMHMGPSFYKLLALLGPQRVRSRLAAFCAEHPTPTATEPKHS